MKTTKMIIGDMLEKIETLRVSMGSPESEGGPTTDCGGPTGALYEAGNHEVQLTGESITLHDDCIVALYAAINIRYIGSGMWVTDYHQTDKYRDFVESAGKIIESYIYEDFWDIIAGTLEYVGE